MTEPIDEFANAKPREDQTDDLVDWPEDADVEVLDQDSYEEVFDVDDDVEDDDIAGVDVQEDEEL